jgi:hypothetical protein
MPQAAAESHSRTWLWTVVLFALLALRLPSLVQPAGGDQQLYSYVADRVLAGDVPYRDAWEQKPPGIFYTYAAVRAVWPRESAVAVADFLAAALIAWALVGLGRRMFGGRVGESAAATFLLLGDPSIHGLGGMNLRAQCEAFIALAVVTALALAARSAKRRGDAALIGICIGVAFWLKYNAVVYGVPITLAAVAFAPAGARWRTVLKITVAAAATVAAGVAAFAVTGALADLRLATIGYNLAYSSETYESTIDAVKYLFRMPIDRALVDGLWFVGGLGSLMLALDFRRQQRSIAVAVAWLAAAVLSIAINGSRGLPQYFVQAAPALALAASAGVALAWRGRQTGTFGATKALALAALLVLGIWRVGSEPVARFQPRLFGLPQSFSNVAFDMKYLSGEMERFQYLDRFGRETSGKYSPLLVEELAEQVKHTTPEDSKIYVFGFASGGIYTKSGRTSASRFFWSRPVVLEFASEHPGYGSAGLLADLKRNTPSMVILQKRDWGLAEPQVPNSEEFFLRTPALQQWLDEGYLRESDNVLFSVWRKR